MSKIIKTDKNKFLIVLCLFNPSAWNVPDYIWVGNSWDRNMSGCVPDGKYCDPMILPFLSLLKTWLMTHDHFLRLRHPGLYLIQFCFKFGLKMWYKPFSCKSQDLYSKSPFSTLLFWDLNLSSMSCKVSNLKMCLFRTQACSLNAVTRGKGSPIFLSLCESEIQTLVNPS